MKKIVLLSLTIFALPIFTMEPHKEDNDCETNPPAPLAIPARRTKMIWNSPKRQIEVDWSLSFAARDGNAQQVIRLLYDNAANPNALKPEPPMMISETPFMTAAMHDHTDICRILIDAGAEPLKRDIWGQSPYYHAILVSRDENILQLLFDAGVDDLALHDLSKINHDIEQFGGSESSREYFARYVEKIVDKYLVEKKDISEIDSSNMTLLHYATQCQLKDACKKLIENKASVNAQNIRKETPLHFAAESESSEEICKLLLEAGADMNIHAQNIRSFPTNPVFSAVLKGNKVTLQLLCAFGANSSQVAHLAQFNPHCLSAFVFAPELNNRSESKSKVIRYLGYLKQIQPQLPRDVQQIILTSCATQELATLMIARKLHGKSIPETMKALTIEALYTHTLDKLKQECDSACENGWGKPISGVAFENEFGPALKSTVIARLAQPKLVCNNSVQVAEKANPALETLPQGH